MRVPYVWNLFNINNSVGNKSLETKLFGNSYPSPLGLAAGFDKDCNTLNNVIKLGFGFVTGGTVTLTSRPGNPKPRVIRITKDKGLICFTINEGIHEEYGFDKKIDQLNKDNKWKEIEFFKSDYIASKDVNAWLGLYKVIK